MEKIFQKKGTATIMAMLTMIVLSTLAVSLAYYATTSIKGIDNSLKKTQATYAAEAGVKYTKAACVATGASDWSWLKKNYSVDATGDNFWNVSIKNSLGGDVPLSGTLSPDTYTVESTGTYRGYTKIIRATLKIINFNPYSSYITATDIKDIFGVDTATAPLPPSVSGSVSGRYYVPGNWQISSTLTLTGNAVIFVDGNVIVEGNADLIINGNVIIIATGNANLNGSNFKNGAIFAANNLSIGADGEITGFVRTGGVLDNGDDDKIVFNATTIDKDLASHFVLDTTVFGNNNIEIDKATAVFSNYIY